LFCFVIIFVSLLRSVVAVCSAKNTNYLKNFALCTFLHLFFLCWLLDFSAAAFCIHIHTHTNTHIHIYISTNTHTYARRQSLLLILFLALIEQQTTQLLIALLLLAAYIQSNFCISICCKFHFEFETHLHIQIHK